MSYSIFLGTLITVAQQPEAEVEGLEALTLADVALLGIILANVISAWERLLAGFALSWFFTIETLIDFISHALLIAGYVGGLFLGA